MLSNQCVLKIALYNKRKKKKKKKKYNYIAFTPLEINLEQMNFIYRL